MGKRVGLHFVEEVTDYLTKTFFRKDLERLITEDRYWKTFVKAAELSSEEEAALHAALKGHLAQEPEDKDNRHQTKRQRKRFLKVFPQLKRKLAENIRKLRSLADHLDKVHRGCTISNVVSSSTAVASGALGILGLALAPVTAGASLALSATSLGLGAAASVNSITTTIVEESLTQSDQSEAKRLVEASMDTLDEIMKLTPKIGIKLLNRGLALGDLRTLTNTIIILRTARASTRSVQGFSLLESASPRYILSMSKGARIRAAGVTSIFLVLDVYNLVTDSMHLYDGAKTESAGALRDLAKKLKEKLREFERIHEALQADLPQ